MSKKDQFSSRWGIVLASLGMAIGAGNLWRFPRLAGQYGGAFIILWIVFLMIWSIPLLISEFAIGRKFKKGVIGSFGSMAGKKLTWMGYFITMCTMGIAFYYSVVCAWAMKYLGFSVQQLFSYQSLKETLTQNPEFLAQYWEGSANGNWTTVALYILAILLGVFVLSKGIQNGLERANRILIPSLFAILIIIMAVALNMPNGLQGLEYMFVVDLSLFSEPKIWIEALSQSAWSTGAGWGLLMTLSSYSRDNEEITLNTFIGAFGNNTASLIAGMAILPAVFALSTSQEEAIIFLQSGNQALTFSIIPKLFAYVQGGMFLSVFFFLALTLAAFTSFLSMLELMISHLVDLGLTRGKTKVYVIAFFVLFGFPSAYSLNVFNNQDWVWGLGLIVSGLFLSIGLIKYGLAQFKTQLIDPFSDLKLPQAYFIWCIILNIGLAIGLIYWWMSQGYSEFPWLDGSGHWNLFDVYSNASVLTQWLLVILSGLLLNNILYRKFVR